MEDIKSNRAFVLYGIGQSYIDQCILLAEYLVKYTPYDVIIYYGQGNYTSYLGPRVKLIKLEDTLFGTKDDIILQRTIFQSIKPYVLLDSLNHYEEITYLDSDIQVTPNINKIFNYHTKITDYPLANRYQWEFLLYGGESWVAEYIRKHIGDPEQCLPTLCSCLIIFNKKCESFLAEWYNLTTELLDEYLSNSKWKNRGHDEGTLNVLMWKYKHKNYLPSNLAWVKNEVSALETFTQLNNPDKQTPHPGDPSHILLESSWGGGMGNSPNKMENLYGFHTIKELDTAKIIYYIIERNFKKL